MRPAKEIRLYDTNFVKCGSRKGLHGVEVLEAKVHERTLEINMVEFGDIFRITYRGNFFVIWENDKPESER